MSSVCLASQQRYLFNNEKQIFTLHDLGPSDPKEKESWSPYNNISNSYSNIYSQRIFCLYNHNLVTLPSEIPIYSIIHRHVLVYSVTTFRSH